MSEYVATTIEIGGDLKKADIPDLLNFIADELSGEDTPYKGTLNADELCKEAGTASYKWGGWANYGTMEDTVTFCVKHKLSYIIQSDSREVYGGFTLYWTPGMKKQKEISSDNEGTTTASIDRVRSLCNLLMDISKEGMAALPRYVNDDVVGDLVKEALSKPKCLHQILRKKLDELLPGVPTLPPLKVV